MFRLSVVSIVAAAMAIADPSAAQTTSGVDTGYRQPPAPIPQILATPPLPDVIVSPDGKSMALLGRESYPPIRALADPILRLAGFRVNPRTNGPIVARGRWLNGVSFEDVATGRARSVALPRGGRFLDARWAPDGSRLAIMMETPTGLELWTADRRTGDVRKVVGAVLNAAFGSAYSWLPDGSGFLVKTVVAGRGAAPADVALAGGPIVQETGGKAGSRRTYEDLLSNKQDELLFDHYFTAQLQIVALDGRSRPLGGPAIVSSAAMSPDGRYVLVSKLKRPYSYSLPAYAFPTEIEVLDARTGARIRTIVDRPAADRLPTGFDARVTGPREVEWRADAPATLVWVEALDGGDPSRAAATRDRVLMLPAPFAAAPATLADLVQRFSDIQWARPDLAVVTTRWWQTRQETRLAVDPSRPGAARTIVQRNYQDRYNDPGTMMTRPNDRGEPVLHLTPDEAGIFVTSLGASANGTFPFLGRLDLTTGATSRLWQSGADHFEVPMALADAAGTAIITRRESKDDPPNYYLRSLTGAAPKGLTNFSDPAPQFAGVTKQTIAYARPDGVKLSGTLYLPAGYDRTRDGPLPMLMWAYPEDFTDAGVASQSVDYGNRFIRPAATSPLFLLTQGYAVLDGPSMPIVGAAGAEPNDSYVEQLAANAKAAIDKVVGMGVVDRDRIAVGGHSYGAFMAANLLAHTDFFRAGIARSGAYNRTLTPFGFQSEQRTYWQATDIYTRMSPFTYVTRIKAPILLIHGEADDNSGTFPIQSERFFAALKGVGATARYVVLPYEAHDYRARESLLDVLAETVDWLDRYVKPRRPTAPH